MVDKHRKGYWKEREQKPERKEYQRKYKKIYMKKYNKKKYQILTIEQKEELRKRRRKLIREKRKKLIDLRGGKCNKCGYKKCISALEFHHKNPKEKEIKLNQNFRLERLIKEAKKCILLCANCHREIHFKK